MSTLKAFSEKERAYHAYQARQNYLRQERSIQRALNEERALIIVPSTPVRRPGVAGRAVGAVAAVCGPVGVAAAYAPRAG